MNHVQNDRGEMVVSVGAPGSIERVKVEYPDLIDCINAVWFQSAGMPGRCVDEAIELIRKRGVIAAMETNSILSSSYYADDPDGSVAKLVLSITTKQSD